MKLDDTFLEQLRNLKLENEAQGRKKVLVLDDDLDILKWFRATQLTRENEFTFLLLNDELRVMEAVLNFHPDLVILDINLNFTTGDKISDVIKLTTNWRIPVIYMSGDKWYQKAHGLPEQCFLAKPLDRRVLTQKIKSSLRVA